MGTVRNLSDHPKLRAERKYAAELEWLKAYHRAHDGKELTEAQFKVMRGGMHWLMRTRPGISLNEAYSIAVSVF